MEQDKIFEQIKAAAGKAESQDFPSLESVWSRVEDKLDNKALAKQNRKWKQWAAAASIVAVLSVGYQFLKPDRLEPEEKINVQPPVTSPAERIVSAAADTTVLRKDADKILERQLQEPVAVKKEETVSAAAAAPVFAKPAAQAEMMLDDAKETTTAAAKDQEGSVEEKRMTILSNRMEMSKGRVFESRGVQEADAAEFEDIRANKAQTDKAAKPEPLFVVDGQAVTARSDAEYKRKMDRTLQQLKNAERDTITVLKEPLYIINGVEYSEESLFGAKPTSPYAPLNKQEILTLSILQDQEAVKAYGEKGKKGVVIITTKNGRPAPKK